MVCIWSPKSLNYNTATIRGSNVDFLVQPLTKCLNGKLSSLQLEILQFIKLILLKQGDQQKQSLMVEVNEMINLTYNKIKIISIQ